MRKVRGGGKVRDFTGGSEPVWCLRGETLRLPNDTLLEAMVSACGLSEVQCVLASPLSVVGSSVAIERVDVQGETS